MLKADYGDDVESEEDYGDDYDEDEDDNNGDDDVANTGLACPFCFEDFDVLGFCCHIDGDHHREARAGVILLSVYHLLMFHY